MKAYEDMKNNHPKLANEYQFQVGNSYVCVENIRCQEELKKEIEPYKSEIVSFLEKHGIDNGGGWYFFVELQVENDCLVGGFGVSDIDDCDPMSTYNDTNITIYDNGNKEFDFKFDFDWLRNCK